MMALTTAMFAFPALDALLLVVHTVPMLFMYSAANAVAAGVYLPAWKSAYTRAIAAEQPDWHWARSDSYRLLVSCAGGLTAGIILTVSDFRYVIVAVVTFKLLGAIAVLRVRMPALRPGQPITVDPSY
jgi:hypothetical protein